MQQQQQNKVVFGVGLTLGSIGIGLAGLFFHNSAQTLRTNFEEIDEAPRMSMEDVHESLKSMGHGAQKLVKLVGMLREEDQFASIHAKHDSTYSGIMYSLRVIRKFRFNEPRIDAYHREHSVEVVREELAAEYRAAIVPIVLLNQQKNIQLQVYKIPYDSHYLPQFQSVSRGATAYLRVGDTQFDKDLQVKRLKQYPTDIDSMGLVDTHYSYENTSSQNTGNTIEYLLDERMVRLIGEKQILAIGRVYRKEDMVLKMEGTMVFTDKSEKELLRDLRSGAEMSSFIGYILYAVAAVFGFAGCALIVRG